MLRKADASLEQWFRRGAGALRQQLDGLQGGLKKLSANLEQLEKSRKSAAPGAQASPASTRTATTHKPARQRRPKKAA